ncbi:antitoxin VapB family protein [Natrarchaeobius sp. A-rgal3]|uniref:antitoxin VapB family protein n=1 Tax=Natrarchaeobius versutus TaxID=1679078 RepID=UPI0035102AFA
MGTKTISLADDAYEKLKAHKREGESFSDVVRRLTGGVTLAEYHGALEEETADELAAIVDHRREERADTHRERVAEFVDELDE